MCERSQTCAQAEVWCTATPTVAAADTWKNTYKSEPEVVFLILQFLFVGLFLEPLWHQRICDFFFYFILLLLFLSQGT